MMLSSAGTIVRLSGVGCVVGSGCCKCRIVVTEGSIPSTSGCWWWRMIVNVGVASVVEARRYECHIAVRPPSTSVWCWRCVIVNV